MEASTRNKSSQGTTLQRSFQRSSSPSGRFFSSTMSSSSAFSAQSDTRSYSILTRSTSPTRVTLGRSVSPSSTVRFSVTPRHQIAASHHNKQQQQQGHRSISSSPKRTCMCSPTTHPGSFRCSLHKKSANETQSYRPNQQLNMRRSAMTNSLVRIGTVEGELVKRALAALIRPSSHSLRRRGDFQPRPSRLSRMSKAEELL